MKDPLKDVPLRDTERSRFDMFERYGPDWDTVAIWAAIALLLIIALVA